MPPAPKPANNSETQRTNVLLETLQKDVSVIAEGVVDVQGRVKRLEDDLGSLTPLCDEVKSMGDVLRGVAKELDVVRFSTTESHHELGRVKTELRLIRSDLKAFDKRLALVEAK